VTANLPCNLDAERLILGSILLDGTKFELIAGAIKPEDFSIEKHRRIWNRMTELHARGERIDRITIVDALRAHKQLESVDGLSYLTSLDDGMPRLPNLDAYVTIVQEKALRRRAIVASQEFINRCFQDPDGAHELLAQAEKVLADLRDGSGKQPDWMTPGQVMTEYPGGLNAFLHPPRGGAGAPTPWPKLTVSLAGLHRGDLVLVAGRPSMGKSIIAMAIGHHTAAQNEAVAVFSLEMTKESLVRRLVSAIGSVDGQSLRTGRLDDAERLRALSAASGISGIPLHIDDSRARTVPAITSALRKLMARVPVRLVIIDHLQLMRAAGRTESRHHELSDISHSLKHLARQFDLTVILVSQLNRDCEREKRRPVLSDLKETGSLEEDADVVLFVHRPERYNRQDPSLRGQAEFIIGKQREGPTGKLAMQFQHTHQRFMETTDQREQEGE
jgi:replicative DNA helicase